MVGPVGAVGAAGVDGPGAGYGFAAVAEPLGDEILLTGADWDPLIACRAAPIYFCISSDMPTHGFLQ